MHGFAEPACLLTCCGADSHFGGGLKGVSLEKRGRHPAYQSTFVFRLRLKESES